MIGKFFDTNILVYAYDVDIPQKHEVAVSLLKEVMLKDKPVLSAQVINEFFIVTTKKIKYPFSPQESRRKIQQLISNFTVIDLTPSITLVAIDIMQKNKLSFWDSLIISAAKKAGANQILSEDL